MTIANTKVLAKVVAAFAVAALALSAFALTAQATHDHPEASGSASACASFNRDLTVGSSGAEVTALQNWLISKGFSIPAGATGYFGGQTQAAVAKYQASVGIYPAAGYFGPITRAKVNSVACAGGGAGAGDDDDDADDDADDNDLEGGAGSVDTYILMSGLNNEEVGEDEEDVEVAGLEIEVDDSSDIRLTAVRLVFNEGTAGSDFEDYASEVSLWLDGEEIARVDADAFNDDNDWTKTVSVDESAIIRAGDTGELVVAISGVSNLDSADVNDTWTVDFRQVRFEDADDATISEDPNTATRTFSFQDFATAADVELKIRDDNDDVNDSRTIQVDDVSDTDNVEVMSFSLEAEGESDLEIKTFGVSVTVTGATNTDDVINNLTMYIDGDEVASANTVSAGGTAEAYIFDDVDYVIDAGDTVDVVIKADFNDIETTAFDEGDTITFALGEEQTDVATIIDVEDEAGEQLGDGDITGSVTGGAFELRSVGIMVSLVSVSETVTANDNAADNDTGTFVIKYNVEAFGGDVYVSNDAAATTATDITATTVATNGVLYLLEEDGSTATTADVTQGVTFSTSGGASDSTDNVLLQENEDADFTLTVVRTNSGDSTDDGLYRTLLKAIGWASTDTTTFNVYDFNLEDYKTDQIYLN